MVNNKIVLINPHSNALCKESAANKIYKTADGNPEESPRDPGAQGNATANDDLEKIYVLSKETLRDAASQEDAATNKAEGNSPDEPVMEPTIKEFTAKKTYKSANGNPKESPRKSTTQENATTSGASKHDLRDTVNQGDVCADETAGPNLRELPEEAVLEVIAANVPCKRSLGFKRKTKKVKNTSTDSCDL